MAKPIHTQVLDDVEEILPVPLAKGIATIRAIYRFLKKYSLLWPAATFLALASLAILVAGAAWVGALWERERNNIIVELRSVASGIPVGTIQAYAGPLETKKQRDTIQAMDWRLCNGEPIACGNHLKLCEQLAGRWGNDPEVTVSARLPNLQGYFLRGVADENDEASKQRSGPPVVGTFQQDSLQQHIHYLPTGHTYSRLAPNGTHRLRSDLPDTARGSPVNPSRGSGTVLTQERVEDEAILSNPIVARVADETRPKNAYVHFIIKVR